MGKLAFEIVKQEGFFDLLTCKCHESEVAHQLLSDRCVWLRSKGRAISESKALLMSSEVTILERDTVIHSLQVRRDMAHIKTFG